MKQPWLKRLTAHQQPPLFAPASSVSNLGRIVLAQRRLLRQPVRAQPKGRGWGQGCRATSYARLRVHYRGASDNNHGDQLAPAPCLPPWTDRHRHLREVTRELPREQASARKQSQSWQLMRTLLTVALHPMVSASPCRDRASRWKRCTGVMPNRSISDCAVCPHATRTPG